MVKSLTPYLFQGEEHQPFTWSGAKPAALLVHGFPGTPAEVRPLGRSLHNLGWTVQGLLLPGFGADIETLFDRDYQEWTAAIERALTQLKESHDPVLLIGYSFGAALSLQVAVAQQPSAIILLAPFWHLASKWQRLVGLLLRPFLRHVRPFQKADFSDPKVRRGISTFLSGLDLDDPAMQQALQELTVPISLFGQLHQVGNLAHKLANQASLPTLVIQGTADQVVRQVNTRQLLQRLAGPVHYVEVETGHDLISPEDQCWPQVERTVLDFAQTLTSE